MDFTERGKQLLAEADGWIDTTCALSTEEFVGRFSHALTSTQKVQLDHLIQLYKRLPTQLLFFHGYLHHIVGESLFRDFVRFANSMCRHA